MASPGIEPGSGASETLILSIVLRGLKAGAKVRSCFKIEVIAIINYFPNSPILLPNIFTAIASNITPKNFRTAINPASPKALSINLRDFKTTIY